MSGSVKYIELYTEHKGQRYYVEIEIRIDDMAKYLAGKAVTNRSKRTRLAFGKAKARLAQPVKDVSTPLRTVLREGD